MTCLGDLMDYLTSVQYAEKKRSSVRSQQNKLCWWKTKQNIKVFWIRDIAWSNMQWADLKWYNITVWFLTILSRMDITCTLHIIHLNIFLIHAPGNVPYNRHIKFFNITLLSSHTYSSFQRRLGSQSGDIVLGSEAPDTFVQRKSLWTDTLQ